MLSQDRAALLLLFGTLALTNLACSRVNPLSRSQEPTQPVAVSSPPPPANTPPVNPSPTATPSSQPTVAPKEAYERALDAAYSAAIIAQSAQSVSDWQLVSSRWQEAIQLLQLVPPSSSYRAIAQSKIAQYQRNLRIAQQQATRPRSSSPSDTVVAASPRTSLQPLDLSPSQTPNPQASATPPAPATASKPNPGNSQVFKAPIKRRMRGTPVIDVTFNGTQTFEMVVDTGASGTVITQAMAQRLGIVSQGEVKANTASAKGVKFSAGRVESIAVNGAETRNVPVAIGGPDLEIGLLGQDFFSKYDVSIKQDVVEFHSRQP
ncbi:MAG TPA: retropepsin-like aspartic protease [Waterburya sp.]